MSLFFQKESRGKSNEGSELFDGEKIDQSEFVCDENDKNVDALKITGRRYPY